MENLPLTEFDLATSGTYMQMIKAYIPFIDLKEQRLISIAIRIAELPRRRPSDWLPRTMC